MDIFVVIVVHVAVMGIKVHVYFFLNNNAGCSGSKLTNLSL